MHATARRLSEKKNLLLAFDAFGTLFTPKTPVPQQYAYFAEKYGIKVADSKIDMGATFKKAFKDEAKKNPCYGKAVGMGEEKWWANVISNTLSPFLKSGQSVPQPLVRDLLEHFSTSSGYTLYPDVLPFFQMLRQAKKDISGTSSNVWKWDKTVVGIITNSDRRVPGLLESFGLRIGPRRVGTKAQRQEEANPTDDDIGFVVLSYDVGCEKPGQRIFDAAVQMGVEMFEEADADVSEGSRAFEKLYVGDSLVEDYRGAIGAGWNAVLLQREGEGSEEELEGVRRIQSFEELKDWDAPKGSI